ncbi:MAG: biosynthetic-type acetolactate synthase large subunit [Candidatus Caldatribacteriota bacterium]|nr:biosynthetic-type acetolactate synthase large subunit [Candidatus Caldatribacteriota bacterium]
MKLTGAQIVVECLKKEGVKVIFGIPGGAIMPLYDVLYSETSIKHILTRHEQGAAHAAEGYARATGKVGVCMATSGPGATNLVTGLANAHLDSIPLVAFTGQVPTSLIGTDAFQEVDISGITLPITKNNYVARDVKDLARIVQEAFYIARTGRPGPVLIDFPKDIQLAQTEFKYPKKVYLDGYKPTFIGNVKQIKTAAQEIKNAKKPIIYAGGGVISSNASTEVRDLAFKTNIPVTTTLMGLGSFPETHPLSLGMLGMHGTAYANYAISAADLIIALGVRFDDRITGKLDEFASKAKIIHIDIDPAEVGKNILVDIPIVGDIKNILKKLNEYIHKKKETGWLKTVKDFKKKYPLKYSKTEELKPQYIMETINKIAKDNIIIVTSVGQHQMWAALYHQYTEPRTFISSGGLGTMGYGFPAALGAKMGCPEKKVICISGDGSFQMNQQEIATAVNNNIAVIMIIMNNGYLGMVRQWQELFFDKRYAETTLNGNPDFIKLVEAYGGTGIRVNKKQEFYPALEKALSLDKFVLIDCIIPKEENVFPMVNPGSPISKMIGVDKL